jgi:FAD/FMN-containing dehydrogenase
LKSDEIGFDLKQLFIGSEGTIGIITAISILCPTRPSNTNVAIFALDSYEAVQKVYTESKKHLGEIMSAFEMFDAKSYEFVRKHQEEAGHAKKVFETEGDFYCLIETGGSNSDHDEEVSLASFFSPIYNIYQKLTRPENVEPSRTPDV